MRKNYIRIMNGDNVTVALDPAATLTDGMGGVSNIIATDVQTTNGVIHVISEVLVP